MSAFDLVIFDCDGVLVDSEAIGNAVLAEVLSGYGVRLSPLEARSRYAGCSVAAIRNGIEESFAVSLPDDWTEQYYRLLIAALSESVTPIDDVAAVVARLQDADLPFCVASQGPLEKTEASLKSARLWEAFAGRVFSAKAVARPKPAPDLFLHAARTCGAAPDRCAVIEDSAAGVQAARAAGMAVFAYCPQGNSKPLRSLGAVTFRSMAELPALLAVP